uniref:DEP domain-containing protein n=1 Tax=Ciona savignyi TaxID=51511 RepID=H2ZAF4_CIOSA
VKLTNNYVSEYRMEFKGRILIYSISGCRHCKAAKEKLTSLNLPYSDVNLDNHPDQRDSMMTLTNQSSVPQIFFNEKHVGGNTEFQALVTYYNESKKFIILGICRLMCFSTQAEEELNKLIEMVKNTRSPPNAPQPVSESNQPDVPGRLLPSEKDEMSSLVEDLSKQKEIIYDHRRFFISKPKSFTGDDLITFIAHEKDTDRVKAQEIGQQLIAKKFIASVNKGQPLRDDSTLYRLLQDSPSNALNAGLPAYKALTSASELSLLIRKTILNLYGDFLSKDGKHVDYKGIGESKGFKDYIEQVAQLQRAQIDELSRQEKLAFYINIYNALVIHANIKFGFPESAWKRFKFFNDASYIIGGHEFNLQEIENGILRSNRKGVGMLSKPFSKSDPRIQFILESNEPLIHFALVCGAKSCPPIKTYSPEVSRTNCCISEFSCLVTHVKHYFHTSTTSQNIEAQLKLAAASFIDGDDGCRVDKPQGLIGLSRIFKWYKEDFGKSPPEVLVWVKEHMSNGLKKQDLTALLESNTYKLDYLTYDWDSNKK